MIICDSFGKCAKEKPLGKPRKSKSGRKLKPKQSNEFSRVSAKAGFKSNQKNSKWSNRNSLQGQGESFQNWIFKKLLETIKKSPVRVSSSASIFKTSNTNLNLIRRQILPVLQGSADSQSNWEGRQNLDRPRQVV